VRTSSNIFEIPVDETKDVDDLVGWFESKELYKKKHPVISIPDYDKFPLIFIVGFIITVGMALIILEEKGKLKAKGAESKRKPKDFLDLLKNSKTEKKIERLIENRYDVDLILTPHHGPVVSEPSAEYKLNDVFGMWKGKKGNLNKVREEQWGKRK
jgi:hypothetical protein